MSIDGEKPEKGSLKLWHCAEAWEIYPGRNAPIKFF